jgi:hypothetical protein
VSTHLILGRAYHSVTRQCCWFWERAISLALDMRALAW